ncbi:MAG TPA: energy transducer TonB [Candidatus Eisenbacteria bacterium]|nr:energy transducer TonB [Candidatus Eisenbacteria bacterium]
MVIPVEELPRPIKTVVPAYPDSGRGVTGTVMIQTLIGIDGRVKEMRVVHSLPGFDEAAKAALRQWVFTPATKEGKPVAVWIPIPLRFKPPDK